MRDVKCYIVNKDIAIFSWELIPGCGIQHQVEITGKSGEKYTIAIFNTLKEAKDFCKRLTR